jgi:hypothetical protein
LIIFILILVLTFLIRAFPRWIYPNSIASDTYFHLDIADKIKTGKFKIPKVNSNYIIPHKHLYPYVYHVLLAFFPKKARFVVERYSVAVFDSLIVLITAGFVKVLFESNGVTNYMKVVNMTALLYAIDPAILRVTGGPRSYNGSPRVLGQLLYLIHIYGFVWYISMGSLIGGAISIFALSLLMLTAKFAFQVVVLLMPFIMIGISWIYVFILVLAFVFSMIISRGGCYQILKYNIFHSYNYFFQQKIILYPSRASLKNYLLNLGSKFGTFVRPGAFLLWLYTQKYYLHILLVIFPVLAFMLVAGGIYLDDWLYSIWVIVIGGGSAFVLTSNKPFLFLGESERYLEYVSIPSFVIFSVFCITQELEILYYIILGYFVFTYLYYLKSILNYLKQMQDTFNKFKNLSIKFPVETGKVIMPLEYYHCKDIVHHYGVKVLSYYPATIDKNLLSEEEMNFLYHNGGQMISTNIEEVVEKYEVDYILVFRNSLKKYLSEIYQGGEDVFYSKFKMVYEYEGIIIFSVNQEDE